MGSISGQSVRFRTSAFQLPKFAEIVRLRLIQRKWVSETYVVQSALVYLIYH